MVGANSVLRRQWLGKPPSRVTDKAMQGHDYSRVQSASPGSNPSGGGKLRNDSFLNPTVLRREPGAKLLSPAKTNLLLGVSCSRSLGTRWDFTVQCQDT